MSQFAKVADELPVKEAGLFKQLIKLYETKAYKKGLKQAEKLLEVVPNHSETSSMKAIFLYLTGKQQEGYDLAKKALGTNMKSDICWHIYGIINRSNRNYKEAIKCYKFALGIAPYNQQILRDLALLQIQTRDLEGYSETRLKLLQQKESLVINWVGYAVAEHLKGDYKSTLNLLESINKITLDNSLRRVEKSELIIYEGMVNFEAGNYQEAFDFLTKHADDVCDKVSLKEMMVDCLLKLDQQEKAQEICHELIKTNPNNAKFHDLLMQSMAKQEVGEELVNAYEKLLEKASSQTIKLQILRYSNVENFKKRFSEYIKPYFRKCLPSLFSELKKFYLKTNDTKQNEINAQKVSIIQQVFEENFKSLKEKETFSDCEQKEFPNCLLWNLMILAQHYDMMGNQKLALEFINQAIDHTPTLLDLYLIKAKIYKHQFNYALAFQFTEKARSLDLADRYLNNKSIKYALKMNKTEEAESLMRLFLRDPNDGNAYDLQTIWFEIAMGNAYLRKKQVGPALKQFKFVEKHYSDMYEDQFDFHTYCMRKYTLKSYVEMIRYEDQQYNSKFFVNAAAPMINALIGYTSHLGEKKKEQDKEEEILSKMNAKEKKAYKRDKEKALAKKLKEEQNQQQEVKEPDVFQQYREKLDLDGKELLEKLTDPLDEANTNFASKLIDLNIEEPQVAFNAFSVLVDLYIARGKQLLCLKALNKLQKSSFDQTEIIIQTIKAIKFLQESLKSADCEDITKQTIEQELKEITQGKSIEEIVKNHSDNLVSAFDKQLFEHKSQFVLQKINDQQYAELVEKSLLSEIKNVAISKAVQAFDILSKYKETINKATRETLSKQFPEADYFTEVKEEQVNGKQAEQKQ